jgi:hypothetical protein
VVEQHDDVDEFGAQPGQFGDGDAEKPSPTSGRRPAVIPRGDYEESSAAIRPGIEPAHRRRGKGVDEDGRRPTFTLDALV